MKVKEDGSIGVSGIVTTHMEGKDSVWMEKTGTLKLKWQEAASPGSEV